MTTSFDLLRLKEKGRLQELAAAADEQGVHFNGREGEDVVLLEIAGAALEEVSAGRGDRVVGGAYDRYLSTWDRKETRADRIERIRKETEIEVDPETLEDTSEKVCCRICGKAGMNLTRHVADKHGLAPADYEAAFRAKVAAPVLHEIYKSKNG